MKITQNAHLTYCTNIHPGKTWFQVLDSLQNVFVVKKKLKAKVPFGIGLRLSAQASEQLGTGKKLKAFNKWLQKNNCYVFTMNGFPYGGFHRTVVKDQVHAPDWTTKERVVYTKRLFDQLTVLLPKEQIGGISTSPISYRFWHKTPKKLQKATEKGAKNMIKVVAHLMKIKAQTGKSMHLDIEPEPDGILENSREFIDFFEKVLVKIGVPQLVKKMDCSEAEAKAAIYEHIQLCYDVCHFAVEYEDPKPILKKLKKKGIRVGKIQISAAIKTKLTHSKRDRKIVKKSLEPYNESTYLHQTVFQTKAGSIEQFPDLGPALAVIDNPEYTELRTHFHVPIFTDTYGSLQSTQDEISKVLKLWKAKPFSQHLEIETYTWEVLPENNRLSLTDSITREMGWVLGKVMK
ncbi:MAG: metabolite traffic protein EboE [Bacteroidota bacterium]